MSATRVDPCGCDEALDLRRQVAELVVERDALKAKASEMRAAMLGLHKMLTRWSNCPCNACSECIEEVCPAWDNACAVFEIPSDDLLDGEKEGALGVEVGR